MIEDRINPFASPAPRSEPRPPEMRQVASEAGLSNYWDDAWAMLLGLVALLDLSGAFAALMVLASIGADGAVVAALLVVASVAAAFFGATAWVLATAARSAPRRNWIAVVLTHGLLWPGATILLAFS